MKRFFNDNVNSILGAISIHLAIVIAFLWFKLGEMNEIKEEQMLIEFNEEMVVEEEEKEPEKNPAGGEGYEEMSVLDQQTMHSIASNVSSKLDKEISTSDYEKQVMNELGISSLESPGKAMAEKAREAAEEENAIEEEKSAENSETDHSVPNIIRKDNTTVSYFLEGRWHRYIYIPTYKCQGGGTIYIDIIINQSGKVVAATISDNKSTSDQCLREEAYRSATSAQFNADPKANPKQLGTITYVFLAQ